MHASSTLLLASEASCQRKQPKNERPAVLFLGSDRPPEVWTPVDRGRDTIAGTPIDWFCHRQVPHRHGTQVEPGSLHHRSLAFRGSLFNFLFYICRDPFRHFNTAAVPVPTRTPAWGPQVPTNCRGTEARRPDTKQLTVVLGRRLAEKVKCTGRRLDEESTPTVGLPKPGHQQLLEVLSAVE